MMCVFCERLKTLRIEKKMSQPELAKLVGVSKGMISFWENGINEPTISNLVKLCQIFEVSSDYLLIISSKDLM